MATSADYALLVGVSRYTSPSFAAFPTLEGPANDVALMGRSLHALWGDDARIAVLGGPDRPATRAAILAELDRLARQSVAGDDVVVYLAGHGTQLPVPFPKEDEPDGMDEAFLPEDTEIVSGGDRPALRNHLLDDDLGARLAAIELGGARVWLIVDACHSGTLLRGAGRGLAARSLDTGVDLDANPVAPGTNAAQPLFDALVGKSTRPGFIAFYAAGPDALAYEQADPTRGGEVHGIFTSALVTALARARSQSFGELARATEAAMWQAGPLPRPMFQGALREPVVRGVSLAATGRFGLEMAGGRLMLRAGQFDGVAAGTVFSVAQGKQPIFSVKVLESGLDLAGVEVLADSDEHPNRLAEIVRNEGLDPGRFLDRWLADRAATLGVETERSLAPLRQIALDNLAAPLSRDLKLTFRIRPGAVGDGACLPPQVTDLPVAAPLMQDGTPVIEHCDAVTLDLRNGGAEALDVSPFYRDADGKLYYLDGYTQGGFQGLRLPPGMSAEVAFTEVVAPGRSGERAEILLFAVPSRPGPPKDFRDLAATPSVDPPPNRGVAGVVTDLRFATGLWPFLSGAPQLAGRDKP